MKSRFQSFYKRTIFAITVRHVISRTRIMPHIIYGPYKMIAQWLWLFLSDILHANDIMIYSKLDSFKCRYIFKILVSDSTLKVNCIEIISIISDLINIIFKRSFVGDNVMIVQFNRKMTINPPNRWSYFILSQLAELLAQWKIFRKKSSVTV